MRWPRRVSTPLDCFEQLLVGGLLLHSFPPFGVKVGVIGSQGWPVNVALPETKIKEEEDVSPSAARRK